MSHNSSVTISSIGGGSFTYWNMQSSVHFLELAKDRLTVKYTGKASHSHDVGAIRADHSLPTDTWVGYYEITIVDAGNRVSISIGLASQEFQLNRMPGMDVYSLGYFGEEGRKHQDGKKGEPYGPGFSSGDIVGCGYNYRSQEVFFTLNGRFLGVAFSNITGILYAVVGLHSPGQIITANFGQHGFKYDLQGYIDDEYQQITSEICDVELKPNLLNGIIQDYLLHYAFEETAIEFVRFMNVKDLSHPLWKTLNSRKEIRRLVLEGRIEEALNMTFEIYPNALKQDLNEGYRVLFLCRCQQFIELIRAGDLPKCLKFMTQNLGTFSKPDLAGVDHLLLKEVVALLAYENPFSSPLQYLLRPESREHTSDALNNAILKSIGVETHLPTLEILLKQLSACERQYREENDHQGPEFSIEKVRHE